MRRMALAAALAGIMFFDFDLLETLRPGGTELVAPQTQGVGQLGQLDIRVVRVRPGDPVTGFAGDGFVFELGDLLQLVGMTFVARFFPGENGLARGQFLERIAAVPAVGAEGGGGEKITRDHVGHHDPGREQGQSDDLGRYFKAAHKSGRGVRVRPLGGFGEPLPVSSSNSYRRRAPAAPPQLPIPSHNLVRVGWGKSPTFGASTKAGGVMAAPRDRLRPTQIAPLPWRRSGGTAPCLATVG